MYFCSFHELDVYEPRDFNLALNANYTVMSNVTPIFHQTDEWAALTSTVTHEGFQSNPCNDYLTIYITSR